MQGVDSVSKTLLNGVGKKRGGASYFMNSTEEQVSMFAQFANGCLLLVEAQLVFKSSHVVASPPASFSPEFTHHFASQPF